MIYEMQYTAKAIKMYSKLPVDVQHDIKQCLHKLVDSNNHQVLKVHKLSGKLAKYYSAYANYQYRVVFLLDKNVITVMAVGDHDVYR